MFFRYYIVGLIFIQIPFNNSKGFVKFRNINLILKAKHELDGLCCSTACEEFCEVSISICLYADTSTDRMCLIEGASNVVLKNWTYMIDVAFPSMYRKPMRLKLIGVNAKKSNKKVFEVVDNQTLTFVDGTWKRLTVHTGTVSLNLEYKLACYPNFYGERCHVECKPQSNNVLGYFTCDSHGNIVCLPGWKGKFCTELTCLYPCVHGICNDDMKCECEKGWVGESCSIDFELCFTRPCLNGGICNRIGKCECGKYFSGSKCQYTFQPPISSFLVQQTNSVYTFPTKQLLGASIMSTFQILTTAVKQKNFTTLIHNTTFLLIPSISQTEVRIKWSVELYTTVPATKNVGLCCGSLYTHDASWIIENTSWIILPSSSVFSASTTLLTQPTQPSPTSISISVGVVLTFFVLSFILFLFLWKKSIFHRRKCQTNIDITAEIPCGRSSAVSSSNSVSAYYMSPMLKNLLRTDNNNTAEKKSDIDINSALDNPVFSIHAFKTPTYETEACSMNHSLYCDQERHREIKSLKETVGRDCIKVVIGHKLRQKSGSPSKIRKTREKNKFLVNNRYQHPPSYSSNGYDSNSESLRQVSLTKSICRSIPSQLSQRSNSLTLLIDGHNSAPVITSQEYNASSSLKSNEKLNSNVLFSFNEPTSSRESSSHHAKQTNSTWNFDELPNYVSYREEDNTNFM